MKLRVQQGFLFLLSAFLLSGCGLFGGENYSWENLNLPVQTGYKLFLSDGDLYVAAGYDGLYYLQDANPKNEWKYLGHKVIDGERHAESGVQTIDVYKDTIIIGYIDPPTLDNGIRIGIWRSHNLGETWIPSDQGIRTEEFNLSSTQSISRSPHNPDRLVSSSSGEIYYSNDGGAMWYPESSKRFQPGFGTLEQGFVWHPTKKDLVWTFGESGFFSPFLGISVTGGEHWERYSNVKVPRDNAFFDMAFDAFNPDLIYVGAQGAVIKSEEGGEEWVNNEEVTVAFTDPKGNFFKALEPHPKKAGALFAAAGPNLYLSLDGGKKIRKIKTPDEILFINDINYDKNKEVLYVTGEYGVFRVKNIF